MSTDRTRRVRAPRSRRVLLLRWTAVALVLLVALLCIGFCVGSPLYYAQKYSGSPTPSRPAVLPVAIVAEQQTEPHTCGLCSLIAVYRAYGLDPEALGLRFRLGTDKPLTNFIPSSRGTIHPDMLRVLAQDGFDARVLRPSAEGSRPALLAHLRQGHPALALVKLSEYHWVVIGSADADELAIHDSLAPAPYRRAIDAYLTDDVYSLVLLSPAPPVPPASPAAR